MSRHEANRIAKHVYIRNGELYLAMEFEAFVEYFHFIGQMYDDSELAMIFDYYERTCRRVADWLGVK